jgi:hypothetical protein
MGQEVACRVRFQNRRLTGRAYLEMDHALSRGGRRELNAAALKNVKACGFSAAHAGLKFVVPVAARVK